MWKPFAISSMIASGAAFLTALAILAGLFRLPDRAIELWLARQGLVTAHALSMWQMLLYSFINAALVGWFLLVLRRLTLRLALATILSMCLWLLVPWMAKLGFYLSPLPSFFTIALTAFWCWIALQTPTARRHRRLAPAFHNRVTKSTWERICQSNYDGKNRDGPATLLTVLYTGQPGDRAAWHAYCRSQMLSHGGVLMPSPNEDQLQAWFGAPHESLPPQRNHAQAAAAAAHETITRWKLSIPPAFSICTGPISYGLFTLTTEIPILQISQDWSVRGNLIARIAADARVGILADIPTYDASTSTFAYRPLGLFTLDAWGAEEILCLFSPRTALTDHQKDRLKQFWDAALATRQGKLGTARPLMEALTRGGSTDPLINNLTQTLASQT